MRYAFEVAGDSATVYISGKLSATDAFVLNRACGELPRHVRTLRLDLHAVDELTDVAMIAVRAVLRYWREVRAGSFRLALASEHLVATYAEGALARETKSMRHALPHVVEASAAQTAMFL